MSTRSPDQAVLTRYLLGDLAGQAQAEVEDRAFSDPDYLAALEAAEADLIDSYVRGELPPPERIQFERLFLTSPRRIGKVEFARALAALPVASPAPRPQTSRAEFRWTDLFADWSLGLRFASGLAAVAFAVGLGWMFVDNANMESRIAALESQGKDLQARHETAERLLNAERQRAASLAEELKTRQSPPNLGSQLLSLVLPPGLTRAESNRTRVTLPPMAHILRIEIPIDARDAFPRFRAELRTLAGQEVLSAGNLKRGRTVAGTAVSFDVPASAIGAGNYELELKGVSADGAPQPLGYFYFRVVKP